MSNFVIRGLPADLIARLEQLDADALACRHIRRLTADSQPGFPCRVSLQDAAIGETVYLLPYRHLSAPSPYRASGPIFIRAGARPANLEAGEIPPVFQARMISARAYDSQHMMRKAEVCMGNELAALLASLFADPDIDYVQLHNARPGCFAGEARRA